ncbi:hypothetical protein HN958_01990 [Candidatus Falkowbacteria bacterium]|jgi:uncharacterized membrane protein YraQ (UPF0718 family)|nr:hypothetical protein [Candidatus Falkowbacteria bacterium]MBT7007255.1 hypothetical protein [Candidatus Falkowbacteria bacterium]
MLYEILIKTITGFLNVLPVLVFAIIISQIVSYYASHKKMGKQLKENEANISKATILGMLSPGPLIAYLPTVSNLHKKGMAPSLVVAFITGQALVGPARVFLEVDYFGWQFFVLRVILAIFIAVGAATVFRLLEKYFKFK